MDHSSLYDNAVPLSVDETCDDSDTSDCSINQKTVELSWDKPKIILDCEHARSTSSYYVNKVVTALGEKIQEIGRGNGGLQDEISLGLAHKRKKNLLKKRKRRRILRKVLRVMLILLTIYIACCILSDVIGGGRRRRGLKKKLHLEASNYASQLDDGEELEELNSVLETLRKNKKESEAQSTNSSFSEFTEIKQPFHQESLQGSKIENNSPSTTLESVKASIITSEGTYTSVDLNNLNNKLDDLKDFLGSVETESLQQSSNDEKGEYSIDAENYMEHIPDTLWHLRSVQEENCDTCIHEHESKPQENTDIDETEILSQEKESKCSIPFFQRFFKECRVYRLEAKKKRRNKNENTKKKTRAIAASEENITDKFPDKIVRPSKTTRSVRKKLEKMQKEASTALTVVVIPKLKRLRCSIPFVSMFFGCDGQEREERRRPEFDIDICDLPLLKHIGVCKGKNSSAEPEDIESLCNLKMLRNYSSQCTGRNSDNDPLCEVPFLKDLSGYCASQFSANRRLDA